MHLLIPRKEDPNKFILLNTSDWRFEILEENFLSDKNKAVETLKIQALNSRDYLIEGRKAAAQEFYNRMDRLCRILDAEYNDELKNALPADENFLVEIELNEYKLKVVNQVKNFVTNYRHNSVWHAIKLIDSKVNPKWKSIFEKIPEALNW